MNKSILKAENRKISGRKVKTLRKEGLLPANIYGKKIKSLSIQLKDKDFEAVFEKAGETGLLEIEIGKEKRPVLVHNVQFSPVSDKPIHVDFLQVDLKEKVKAEVPVEIVGESPAQKQSLGTVVTYIDEIEVEALPSDLPDKFDIDVSKLVEVNQAIYIKDLKIDKNKVQVKNDPDSIIVKVEEVKEEVVEAPVTPEVTEEAKEEAPESAETEAVGEQKPETEPSSEVKK